MPALHRFVAVFENDQGVVAAPGDQRHDRHVVPERQPDEARAPPELDALTQTVRPEGVLAAAGEHQQAVAPLEHGHGPPRVVGDCPGLGRQLRRPGEHLPNLGMGQAVDPPLETDAPEPVEHQHRQVGAG